MSTQLSYIEQELFDGLKGKSLRATFCQRDSQDSPINGNIKHVLINKKYRRTDAVVVDPHAGCLLRACGKHELLVFSAQFRQWR